MSDADVNVKIEIPADWVEEFEMRAASMELEAEDYCYAVLALSLQQNDSQS